MARKGKVLKTTIDIQGNVDASVEKSAKKVNDAFDNIKSNAIAITAPISDIFDAIADAVSYLPELGDAYDAATDSIAARTGAIGEDLEALNDVMDAVYADRYGDTMEDVADAVALVHQQLDLLGDDLQTTTEGAFALEETFGYDVAESVRAAKAMMLNFGVDGQTAMGMIAAGAQNGLDYSGELLDSISEYSVQFAKLGFTADEMFHIFQQGADSGAWNLDKVGDAVKEFSIRSIDGSKSTIQAYKDLGFSADEAMAIFASGGDDAEYAFQVILKELIAVEDLVKRDSVGVALFGTMWEDLGVDAVASMIDIQSGVYDTEDALGKINAVKYDSFNSAMEGIQRTVEMELIPVADAMTSAFVDAAPEISDSIIWAIENCGKLLPIVSGITAAFAAYRAISLGVAVAEGVKMAMIAAGATTITAASVATWALNGAVAFLTSPIVIATAAIAALVAAGVWLYQNWDLVKEKAVQLGDFLGGVWEKIAVAVSGFLWGITDGFVTAFSALAGIVKGPINAVIGIVNGAINAINSIGFTIPSWVPLIGGKAFSVNIPNLPMLAAGGHTDGVSIAGEDGLETVISYDPAYRAENLSYWAEAGRMLGASDYLLGEGGGDSYSFDVTFAPQITIQGNADQRSVMDAIEDEYPEFCDMLESFLIKKGLIAYA